DHAETYLPPDHTQEYAARTARDLFPQAFLPRMRSIKGHHGQQVDDETAQTILGLVRNRVRVAPGEHQALIVRESLYPDSTREGVFVVAYDIDEYTRYAVVVEDEETFDVEDTTVEVYAIQYYEHLVRDLTDTMSGYCTQARRHVEGEAERLGLRRI
ncbi:MAG TPA: hypothetical protein VK054_12000, partial [Beutenbergiaceae bacterium]|nr:hypothetical protein [Beutenbergiaceae bacterium]